MGLEISSREELKDWLQDKRVEWGQEIAVRAALRVFPLVLNDGYLSYADDASDYMAQRSLVALQVFRAVFLSRAVLNASNGDKRGLAASAARAASAVSAVSAISPASVAFAVSAAARAADAAYAAYDDNAAPTTYGYYAARAVHAAVHAARLAAFARHTDFAAVNADCVWLMEKQEFGNLISQPLWLNDVRETEQYLANFPDWARSAFDYFAQNDEWQLGGNRRLIVDWYRALLPNIPNAKPTSAFGEAADLAIATQPNDFWNVSDDRSAKQILDEIAEIVEAHEPDDIRLPDMDNASAASLELEEDISSAVENIQPQTPAAYRFGWRDGRIEALPPSDISSDSEGAQIFLDEVRRKGQELQGRLERSNSDPRVKNSVHGLLDVLTERVEDLRPQLVRSRARSIEADALAFGNAKDGELELFPGAVAALVDLSETVRDLQGCYPQLRVLEAEIAALELDPSKLEQTKDLLDQVVDEVQSEGELVDPSAQSALQTVREIAEEDAPEPVRQKRLAEYALVVRNFISPIACAALDNAFTREAKRLGSDIYEKGRPLFVDNAAGLLGKAPTLALAGLVYAIWGPVAGAATAMLGFEKIDTLLKLAVKWLEKKVQSEEEQDAQGEQDDEPEMSAPPSDDAAGDGDDLSI